MALVAASIGLQPALLDPFPSRCCCAAWLRLAEAGGELGRVIIRRAERGRWCL